MTTNTRTEDDLLVERFVASFQKLDDFGPGRSRPMKAETERSSLERIYSELPGRFPSLFERLVLSYRWPEVDLGAYRLMANPPGTGLDGLLHEMSKDPILWNCLLEAGYLQFGKGLDVDYDPV